MGYIQVVSFGQLHCLVLREHAVLSNDIGAQLFDEIMLRRIFVIVRGTMTKLTETYRNIRRPKLRKSDKVM